MKSNALRLGEQLDRAYAAGKKEARAIEEVVPYATMDERPSHIDPNSSSDIQSMLDPYELPDYLKRAVQPPFPRIELENRDTSWISGDFTLSQTPRANDDVSRYVSELLRATGADSLKYAARERQVIEKVHAAAAMRRHDR